MNGFTYPSIIKFDQRDGEHNITATLAVARREGQRDYITLTGSEWGVGNPRTEMHLHSGAIHDKIVAAFPDLELAAALHLSDAVTGEPMHAREDLRYWFGLSPAIGKTFKPMIPDSDYGRRNIEPFMLATDGGPIASGWAPEAAAAHLRVSVDEVRQIHADVLADSNDSARIDFVVKCQRKRWASEAAEVVAMMKPAHWVKG